MTDVWVVNDDGSEIVRARDIAVSCLDYDGNVTVRLAGANGAVVKIAGHRAHLDERRPDDFHRQLLRVIAELGLYSTRGSATQFTPGWIAAIVPKSGRAAMRFTIACRSGARPPDGWLRTP